MAESHEQTILFVGVTGQATEASVLRRDSSRIYQLSTAGHWHTGTLPWLHKLVDLATRAFVKQHNFDPRKSSKTAASLQIKGTYHGTITNEYGEFILEVDKIGKST